MGREGPGLYCKDNTRAVGERPHPRKETLSLLCHAQVEKPEL